MNLAFESDHAERLAKRLGIEFHDLSLLHLALLHRSTVQDLANANPDRELTPEERVSNERLEFLGDAVLGYIVADYLYKSEPEATEGQLTAQRIALVRAEQLVRWARELDLADYLYLGQGEKVTEGARDRMLAGAFEAVIGAIALDRGLREAGRFLRHYVKRDAALALTDESTVNAKGQLQEYAQDKLRVTPVYHLVSDEGPAHARNFIIEARLGDAAWGRGEGASKRVAEQAAARDALANLAAAKSKPKPAGSASPRKRRRRSGSAAASVTPTESASPSIAKEPGDV